jgi:hypothetical protein
MSDEILVLDCRLAFHKGVFEKTAFAGDAKAKPDYNCKFILPPDHPQIKAIEALELSVAKEKWGAKADAELKLIRANDRAALHDGDTQRSDGFAGNFYLSARSDQRPTTYDRLRKPVTAEDGVIYSGCYVNAKVLIWAQDNKWGKRINCQVLGVQFARDGDSFAAGAPPAEADDFPELDASDAPADDPLFS